MRLLQRPSSSFFLILADFFKISLVGTLFGGIVACGSRSNSHFALSPTDEFDPAFEPFQAKKSCETKSTHGCAALFTSGTAVNGSFNFDDMFTSCSVNANGTNIRISNMPIEGSTFDVSINLYKVTSPLGLYACEGPKVVANPPELELKPGTCDVIAQVHHLRFAARPTESCFLSITSTAPLAGNIICQVMSKGTHTLTISEGSRFTCPQ